MRLGRLAPLSVLIGICFAGGPSATPAIRVVDLLDQYASGQFDAAVSQLSERTDFDDLLKQLQRDGAGWIDARGAAEQPRRKLAAATFALEAARIDEWHEWKWIQRGEGQTLASLSWRPAPLLIEWGCALFRSATPQPVERWWQLAALAVAQRSEDPQFLVGDLNTGLGAAAAEIGNSTEEIRHLDHASSRFPLEGRFVLAEGIAREWSTDIAVRARANAAFAALKSDIDIGGEATMRSGAMAMRDGHLEAAMATFRSVEPLTRDPYVVYLARYFKGQAAEQLRRVPEAEAAYRGAAATVPGAQGASLSLGTMLFDRDQREESQRFAAGAIARTRPADPWREYAHADDRFWPRLLERLRFEIHSEAPAVASRAAAATTPANAGNNSGSTDVVAVDVAVRTGATPLAGLSAADFVLLDNGVKQRIDSVGTDAMPLDVTLVLDLSGDQRGLRTDPVNPSAVASDVNESVRQVTELLRPDDRLRVLGSDSYVQTIVPLQPARSVTPIVQVSASGLSSMSDALIAALLQPVDPARRHVVIFLTKGRDTVSATSFQSARAIAERSDVRLYILMMEREGDAEADRFRLQCSGIAPEASIDTVPLTATGFCWPVRRFWVPFDRRTMEVTLDTNGTTPVHRLLFTGSTLADAAALTGGGLRQGIGAMNQGVAAVLRSALDEFNQSYTVRYTPLGVKRDGWHTLSVTVPGSPGANVRARRGYVMPVPEPAAPPLAVRAARAPATYPELVDLYSRSQYEIVGSALHDWRNPEDLIKRLDESGNPWPATPRREATFALELAEAGLFSRRQETFDDAVAMLRRFHRLVRDPLEPEAFERYWLWTELTILQGKIRPGTAEPFVRYALERFPEEPRFLLARAIVTDQLFPFMGVMRSSAQTTAGTATGDHIANVIDQYTAAMKAPETATEARIRLAWFLYRVGRYDDALARLDEIRGDGNDRAMGYLHQLFRGHIQLALGHVPVAIDAYRRAIERWPTAQSPSVALMSALLQAGDQVQAEAVAERILTAPADQTDPWFTYWLGDYRLYPVALGTLQEMLR